MQACGEPFNRYLNVNRTDKLNREAERGSKNTKTAEENIVWGKHGGQQMTGAGACRRKDGTGDDTEESEEEENQKPETGSTFIV